MKRIKYTVKLLALVMVFSSFTPAGITISETDHFLFKINRSRDADEIRYMVNLTKNGTLNNNEPIKAYWVRKTKNNETEPLTWVQKKYAYGIHITQPYDKLTGNLKFQFVSYARQTFELRKSAGGDFKVYTSIDNKEIEVARIFVQIDGGSFWVPSVPYVKLTGYDAASSDLVAQTIIP